MTTVGISLSTLSTLSDTEIPTVVIDDENQENQENQEKEKESNENSENGFTESSSRRNSKNDGENPSIPRAKQTAQVSNPDSQLQKILENESKTPWFKILILFGVLILVSVHSLLVGGKGDSVVGIVLCSPVYWGTFITIFPLLIAITVAIGYYLVKREFTKQRLHYKFAKGDVRWSPRYTLLLSCFSFFGRYSVFSPGYWWWYDPLSHDA